MYPGCRVVASAVAAGAPRSVPSRGRPAGQPPQRRHRTRLLPVRGPGWRVPVEGEEPARPAARGLPPNTAPQGQQRGARRPPVVAVLPVRRVVCVVRAPVPSRGPSRGRAAASRVVGRTRASPRRGGGAHPPSGALLLRLRIALRQQRGEGAGRRITSRFRRPGRSSAASARVRGGSPSARVGFAACRVSACGPRPVPVEGEEAYSRRGATPPWMRLQPTLNPPKPSRTFIRASVPTPNLSAREGGVHKLKYNSQRWISRLLHR